MAYIFVYSFTLLLYCVPPLHAYLYSGMSLPAYICIEMSFGEYSSEDFGIQEQTSTELVHLYFHSAIISVLPLSSTMQRSCSRCLARHTSLGVGGTRSYGIVPKSNPPSKPDRDVDTPPRPSYNRLNGPSSRSDSGRRHEGSNQGYGMRAGEQSRFSKDGGSARRARVAGYLDNVKSGESSSTPITSKTTPEKSHKRIHPRNEDTTHRYDRPSRESRNQDPTSVSSTKQFMRKPLYPPPTTPEADSGPSRRKVCMHSFV
jgi:hypothetical protein